jgi:N-acetylglutamate synthase/N-acetylornithine aminotransferase
MVELKRCYLYDRIVLAGVKHNEHYDLVLLNLSEYSSEVSRLFTGSQTNGGTVMLNDDSLSSNPCSQNKVGFALI